MNNFPDKIVNLFLSIKEEKQVPFTLEQFKAMSVKINPHDGSLDEVDNPVETVVWLCETYGYKEFVETAIDNLQREAEKEQLLRSIQKLKEENVIHAEPPICCAPYTSLNFDSTGNVNVCCYNRQHILGTYPNRTIKEMWDSPERKDLIAALSKLDFTRGCDLCYKGILALNKNILIKKYNTWRSSIYNDMPISMDFEFGTICNYECIMCGGKWSSSIRKNREKLTPLTSPYDDAFINQLKEFIPHLTTTNFLGGEPFLTPLYYKIWDSIAEINPNISVLVTTNGSILNTRIEDLFTRLPNMGILLSIDSLTEANYNFIRKNGNFNQVSKNIERLLQLGRLHSLLFCPLIQNIYETHKIVEFCYRNKLRLYFNTVHGPLGSRIKGIHENGTEQYVWNGRLMEKIEHVNDTLIPEFCLETLPKKELEKILEYLNCLLFYPEPYKTTIEGLKNLIQSYLTKN